MPSSQKSLLLSAELRLPANAFFESFHLLLALPPVLILIHAILKHARRTMSIYILTWFNTVLTVDPEGFILPSPSIKYRGRNDSWVN